MPKSYEVGTPADFKLLRDVMAKWHPDLLEVNARVGLILVTPATDKDGEPTGPAISVAGNPAAAKIRRTNAKQRLHMPEKYDAIIDIDAEQWAGLDEDEQMALLDHELSHLAVSLDKDGHPQTTDDLRPKLKGKPDDFAMNGFFAVVKRHGRAALEYQSVRQVLFDERGQGLFDFVEQKQLTVE